MRFTKGNIIENPLVTRGLISPDSVDSRMRHIYIPDDVKYRVVEGENQSSMNSREHHRLLRKAEFESQDEFIAFVKMHNCSKGKQAEATEERWKRQYDILRKKNSQHSCKDHSPYPVKSGQWSFGDDSESSCKTKTDKLLAQGKVTARVKRLIEETVKEIKLGGLETMLTERYESCKRKRIWREEGDDLDIDRLMSGDPNHWIKFKRHGKKRVVRLGMNLMASWGNNWRAFAKSVALAYVTAEALETLGYGVEIVAVSTYSIGSETNKASRGDEAGWTFPLKRSSEPVDIQRVGSVGITAMARHYSFTADSELWRIDNGCCKEPSQDMLGFLNLDMLASVSWSYGDRKSQCERITKLIDKVVG